MSGTPVLALALFLVASVPGCEDRPRQLDPFREAYAALRAADCERLRLVGNHEVLPDTFLAARTRSYDLCLEAHRVSALPARRSGEAIRFIRSYRAGLRELGGASADSLPAWAVVLRRRAYEDLSDDPDEFLQAMADAACQAGRPEAAVDLPPAATVPAGLLAGPRYDAAVSRSERPRLEDPILVVCDSLTAETPVGECGPYVGAVAAAWATLVRHRLRFWMVDPRSGTAVAETTFLTSRPRCPQSIAVSPQSQSGVTLVEPVDHEAVARWYTQCARRWDEKRGVRRDSGAVPRTVPVPLPIGTNSDRERR